MLYIYRHTNEIKNAYISLNNSIISYIYFVCPFLINNNLSITNDFLE